MRKRILLGASLPEGGPPGTDGWGEEKGDEKKRREEVEREEGGEREQQWEERGRGGRR